MASTVLLRPRGLLTPLTLSPGRLSGLVRGLLPDLPKTFLNFEAGDFPLASLLILFDLEVGRSTLALSKSPTLGDDGGIEGGLFGEGDVSGCGGSTRAGTLCIASLLFAS